jgi:uncharacterized protein YbjQ (UPF0145 family)
VTEGPESAEQTAASVAALSAGGLPFEAAARLGRMSQTHSWTSDLSVDGFAAVRGVGFEPVGQVMGSTVDQIGNSGFGGCGATWQTNRLGMPDSPVVGVGSSSTSPWRGFAPRVRALYAARKRAMDRLEQECVALGGDGVIGVRLFHGRFPGAAQAIEFQAIGTAVRSVGRSHPKRPFTTDLSAQEFAKLLHARWVPCGLVMGVSIAVGHNGTQTWNALRTWSNAEVPSYTAVVHEARQDVRRELEVDVQRKHGDGVVLQEMTLRVWEQECGSGGRDSVAEATLIGTAIARFEHDAPPPPVGLHILRLDQQHEGVVSRRLTDQDREHTWR